MAQLHHHLTSLRASTLTLIAPRILNGVAVVKGAEKPVIETKDKYGIYGPLQKATLQKITTLSEKVTKMEDQLVKLTATVEEQKKLIASQSVL